jgi:hypothetical protein
MQDEENLQLQGDLNSSVDGALEDAQEKQVNEFVNGVQGQEPKLMKHANNISPDKILP